MLWLALAFVLLAALVLAVSCLLLLIGLSRIRPQHDPRTSLYADLARKYFEKYLAEVQKQRKPIPEIDSESGLPAWVVDRNDLNKN